MFRGEGEISNIRLCLNCGGVTRMIIRMKPCRGIFRRIYKRMSISLLQLAGKPLHV